MKTTIVTCFEGQGVGVVIDVIHSYESPDELLEAIHDFAKEWAATDEGKQADEEACYDFNWGDLAEWSPVLRGKIPGVRDIVYVRPAAEGNHTVVVVDHDELLMG